MSAGHALATRLTPSSSLKLSSVVFVRVTSCSANWIRASLASGAKAAGAFATSALRLRKSALSTSIWLAICSSEMFCSSVL